MVRPVVVVLILLTPLLAGCTSPSQPQSATDPPLQADDPHISALAAILPFEAISEDGTALRGHIYLPDGEGPFATVLELSIYWNTVYGESDRQAVEKDGRMTLARPSIAKFLDAGFAVALVNVRGTGLSDGCFQFGRPLDWSDAYTVIEALAAAEWSNGNVGMTGLSYPGWTQFMAVAAKPPSLKAIIPSSGIIDPWNNWGRNGAVRFDPGGPSFFMALATTGAYSLTYPHVPATGPDHFACPQHADHASADALVLWEGDRTPYWETIDLRPHIAGSTVPTFITNGIWGGESHDLQFEGLWDLLAGDKRMMVGNFGHAYPDAGGSSATSVRDDFPAMAVAWMDHYLRGGPQLVEPGIVEYQDHADVWHTTTRWPPAAEQVPLYLSEGSLVLRAEDVRASTQTFQSQHHRWGTIDCPGGQAVYVSPPLLHDVLLAGNFVVNLTLTSDLPDGNLAIHLYHITRLYDCATTDWADTSPESAEVRRALGDLRHATGDERGRDFPLNTPTPVGLRSHPFATPVKAGERLFLTVAAGSPEIVPDARMPSGRDASIRGRAPTAPSGR